MLIKSNVKSQCQKQIQLFPESIFGNPKTDAERKEIMKTIEKELKEKENYKPELTLLEKHELGKQLIEASEKGDLEKVKELIEKGADLNIQDKYGFTALILSANNDYTKISQMLIENSADLNVQNNEGKTALIMSAYKKHIEISKLLIEKGADLNIQDNDGNTALILSANNGHTKISQMLIEKGADLNIQDKTGNTAFIWSAFKGHTKISQMLIENGADLNVRDINRKTALDYVKKNEIIEMLRKAGAK